jgi:ribonuclease P protein component
LSQASGNPDRRGALCFPRSSRLARSEDFRRALRRRPSAAGPSLVLHACANGGSGARLGLVIGRRELPRAVDRNRVKRLLREGFRRERAALGAIDLVVRLKKMERGKVDRLAEEFQELLALIRKSAP